MQRKSEYFSSLSASAKDKYERKEMATDLKVDPYSIERWHEDAEVFPRLLNSGSDIMIIIFNCYAKRIHSRSYKCVICLKL